MAATGSGSGGGASGAGAASSAAGTRVVVTRGRGSARKELVVHLLQIGVSAAVGYLLLRYASRAFDPTQAEVRASQEAVDKWKKILQDSGRAPIDKWTRYELILAKDLVDPSQIDVTFASIGGLDHVIQDLLELTVYPIRHHDLFVKSRLTSHSMGVLLFGPPGTGKTMLAKAIAKESGAFFLNVNVSSLLNKYVGESQKMLEGLFSLATKLSPTIIFIDEIDGLLNTRNDSSDSNFSGLLKTQFMTLWDGLTTGNGGHPFGVLVIGASNRPWEIDPAVLRRMPRAIQVGLPDTSQRTHILKVILRDESLGADVSLRHLAERTEGFSGSDLTELCRTAARMPILDAVKRNALVSRPISNADFESALTRVRPTGEVAAKYFEAEWTKFSPFINSVRVLNTAGPRDPMGAAGEGPTVTEADANQSSA